MTSASAATPATKALDALGLPYKRHLYDYVDRGGAQHAADCLGVDCSDVIKTLVLRDDRKQRLVLCMHGDRQVSMKRLARAVGARRVMTCSPEEAFRVTGYVVGGISPFGLRTKLPLYAESSILSRERIWLNGGRRGLLLELSADTLQSAVAPTQVEVAAE